MCIRDRVYTFAILTRLTYEDIESAELAPYHALCAMGAVQMCIRDSPIPL